jgi:hypothetical protein
VAGGVWGASNGENLLESVLMAGTPKKKSDLELLNKIGEDTIVAMFEDGKSIADICIALGIGKRALDVFIDENDLSPKITRARAHAADLMAVETVQIADQLDEDHPSKAALRIKTRQWIAERWDQKTYGLQKAQQININVQDLRMNALRHVEVVEDLSTEVTPKLST